MATRHHRSETRETLRRSNYPLKNIYYQGPVSDHFDGKRFYLPGLPSSDRNLLEILKWRLCGKRAPWPKRVFVRDPARPAPRVEELVVTHVGHASYLIQAAGQNILVDPVWAERASPVTWAGPRRHNPPGIAFEDLPPIDAVAVTHNHYDHLDVATLRRLWEAHRPRIIAPLGNDVIIRSGAPQIEVQTGDWWSSFTLAPGHRLTIVPSYHWSSRRGFDRRMALWGGFIFETPAGSVYAAGDTGYRNGAIFKEIGRRFGPPLVAMLPIGAYAPRWFMRDMHANPEEAVQIAEDCAAQNVLGIHWGTFELTDEPYDEPAKGFAEAIAAKGLDPKTFQALRPGDAWSL